MPTIDLECEVRESKRRIDLAESRLSQLEGKFEFISGQLRDIQLWLHARFEDVDRRIDRAEQKVNDHIRALRQDLSAIVGDVIREALRTRG